MSGHAARIAFLVAVAVAAARCSAAPPHRAALPAIAGKVWMHIDGKWQRPPADNDYPSNYRSAPATLMRLSADHEFTMMHCWIIDDAKTLAISPGDGQAIYIGTWESREGGAVAKFRLVFETVQPVGGGVYPGGEETATVSVEQQHVRFRGKRFDEAKALPADAYEAFIAPERGKHFTRP